MFSHTLPARVGPGEPAGAVARARSVARATAFWLAVALPLAYLPIVLVAPRVLAGPSLLVGAVTGNLLALVVGHGHDPSLGPFSGNG